MQDLGGMQELAETRACAIAPSAPLAPVHRRFARFAWGVLAYNVAVILWGALVRATGSGAGCGGHWPLCNGAVLPSISQIGTAIELTHRVMSGVALALVAGMFVSAWKTFAPGHPARRWANWSLIFILTEALLGASLVLLGHVARNESVGRVYSLGLHLINTFLLLASLALTAHFTTRPALRKTAKFSLALSAPLIALVFVAIAGAITALGDTLFPAHTLAEGVRNDFSSTASFLIRLRILHPLLALGAGGAIALIAIPACKLRRNPLAGWVLALFLAQVAAGAATILLQAPLPLQLLHLLIADALWIALVLFTAEAAVRK
ncbi:MAG: COX15/CtaA family protein [Acidobacteriota bacterium]|nr:COX15/CtaA family protein [Acidobacteriota bacterium]